MKKAETLIIAEAGVNHNGDMALAHALIEVAVESGADLVKFQTFRADSLVTPSASKAVYQKVTTDEQETQYEMLRRLEMSEEMHKDLVRHSAKHHIGFFSTAFDIEGIHFLVGLQQSLFKVPSGEITNLPYLRCIGGLGKEVILSTGMASFGEVESALNILEEAGTPRDKIIVLHCTTAYPTAMPDVNLRAMETLQKAFGVRVGYSDHTAGIEVPIAAVAMGATVIEKHLTMSHDLPGPDHKASLEPEQFKAMVASIRNIEMALGDGHKRPSRGEYENRDIIRKSLVATQTVFAGEVFTQENLGIKRPGTGISPMLWDTMLGRIAKRDYVVDELIDPL